MNRTRTGYANRTRDWLYRQNKQDVPPPVDWATSIRETRAAYKDMPDIEFAAWYSRRYGLNRQSVLNYVRNLSTTSEK